MCDISSIIFSAINLTADDIEGQRVLEVGSRDVNGSLRPLVEHLKPSEYIGTDLRGGPNVDLVCCAEDLLSVFAEEDFGVVISTEVIEHVKDWRKFVSVLKRICKPGGIILLTTRSFGFPYHRGPVDYWRFELEDIANIFSDCEVLKLEPDSGKPGVFAKLKKPEDFIENDLADYELFSMIACRRIRDIREEDYRFFLFKKRVWAFARRTIFRVAKPLRPLYK
jgi:SAM-dependent methyltransferase